MRTCKMNDLTMIFLTLGAGIVLGVLFFGGLWWTTKKGLQSKKPVLWFAGSLIVRLGITLPAFFFISNHHWERILICLLGFILARALISKYTQEPEITKHQ